MTKRTINLSQLIKQTETKALTKEQKLKMVIDAAYKRIYQIKEVNGKSENEKAMLLTEICEQKTYEARNLRIKETVNKMLSKQL